MTESLLSPLLSIEGLCKGFDGRSLFEDVSLAVSPGEVVCLMGPSGTGKTTLLRCCNGLSRADRGLVRVGATELRSDDAPQRFEASALAVRRRLGFVFQGWHLFAHRTVLQNVMEAPVFVRHEAPDEVRVRALGLLEEVGIAHRACAMPHELSGGEQQRAAVARALAMRPEMLLLDEPTSALDDDRGDAVALLLRGLADRGLALLVVTHDARFARALSGRVLRLDGGRVV